MVKNGGFLEKEAKPCNGVTRTKSNRINEIETGVLKWSHEDGTFWNKRQSKCYRSDSFHLDFK